METEPVSEGRCVSCGFLAKFDLHYDGPPPYVYEMPPKDRGMGQMSGIRLEAAREIYGFPQCYVNAFDLRQEIEMVVQGGMDRSAAARQVFDTDRHCSEWCSYTSGFSPQDHLTEKRMLQLERDRKEFELLLEKDRKIFELILEKRNRNFQIFLTIVVGILAVAELVASLLQVLYPSGWPLLQNVFGINH